MNSINPAEAKSYPEGDTKGMQTKEENEKENMQ
jgi:hypothetical protein